MVMPHAHERTWESGIFLGNLLGSKNRKKLIRGKQMYILQMVLPTILNATGDLI